MQGEKGATPFSPQRTVAVVRKNEMPVQTLKDIFLYDDLSGSLTWRVQRGAKNHAGKPAGWIHPEGYRYVQVSGKTYSAHRICWAIFYGAWPSKEVDHINGSKDDNRISNLRLATRQQNNQNVKLRKDNRSGLKGVFRCGNKWGARITKDGKTRSLGVFPTPAAAHTAYRKAAEDLHKEFARYE